MDDLVVGDRIELVNMPHDPDPIPVGTRGTVTDIVDLGFFQPGEVQICVDWDIPRSLRLCVPPDEYRIVVTPHE